MPGTLLTYRSRSGSEFRQPLPPTCRNPTVSQAISWIRQSDHVRGEEGGNHGDCYDNRVEEGVCHLQRQTQTGDNEGELTDLCQRETGLDGDLYRLPGEQHA